jgi:hypothetical protein
MTTSSRCLGAAAGVEVTMVCGPRVTAPHCQHQNPLGGSGAVDFHTYSYLRASRKELMTCFQSSPL